MSEASDYIVPRSSIRVFAGFMERKLKLMDSRKGIHWSVLEPPLLLKLLKKEVEELEQAMITEGPERILDEAVDVANFSMMIADIAMDRPRQPLSRTCRTCIYDPGCAFRMKSCKEFGNWEQKPYLALLGASAIHDAYELGNTDGIEESIGQEPIKGCPCGNCSKKEVKPLVMVKGKPYLVPQESDHDDVNS